MVLNLEIPCFDSIWYQWLGFLATWLTCIFVCNTDVSELGHCREWGGLTISCFPHAEQCKVTRTFDSLFLLPGLGKSQALRISGVKKPFW